MKRFLASVVFLLIAFSCFSQELNKYKYVVIPYKFEFLSKHDSYRVNTLVRHLFKKEGFKVLYDNEKLPEELVDNSCLGLSADINNKSNIFTMKMAIVLRDCSNQIIMETPFGRSKIKAYEKGYNQALRRAFAHIEAKNYSYQPEEKVVAEVPPPPPPVVVEEMPKKVIESKVEEVVVVEETVKETATEKPMVKTITKTANAVLYAQPIENGYQLVDSSPKVVMILLKTGVPNVYLVKGQDATVYKENGKWVLSKSTKDGNKKSMLNVKF